MPNKSPDPQTRFSWPAQARCFVKGVEIDFSESGATSGAPADLATLHRAITQGRAFHVGAGGITLLDHAPDLHCETGGTSGAPKVIRRTRASWIASFDINRARFSLGPQECYAVLGDLAHSLALYGLIEALHLGARAHLMAGMGPRAQADLLARARVTVLYATPAQLRLLTRAEGGAQVGHLRHILCGGGAVDAGLRAQIAGMFPNAELTEFYGASETSFIAMSDPETPQGSVGRPYPQVQIKVAAAAGDIGEIWVKSPYLFEGYAEGDHAQTRRADGFLTVGELGYIDAQGYVFVMGRAGRMVRIAEHSVFPEAVETVMTEAASGRHCAVIAQADPARGAVLIGVVSGAPDPELAAEIAARCRARFGPLIAPKRIVFWQDFPLLPSGKPNLAAIAAGITGGGA